MASISLDPAASLRDAAPNAPAGARQVLDLEARALIVGHLWIAFAAFVAAAVLGVWQMWVRTPLPAPYAEPYTCFLSVTLHGTAMAYVLPTFFIMEFGSYVAETALDQPLPGRGTAWAALVLGAVGVVMAVVPVCCPPPLAGPRRWTPACRAPCSPGRCTPSCISG